jgi:hypothetical protein
MLAEENFSFFFNYFGYFSDYQTDRLILELRKSTFSAPSAIIPVIIPASIVRSWAAIPPPIASAAPAPTSIISTCITGTVSVVQFANTCGEFIE